MDKARSSEGRLGAFVGVFTPTVLTILGVILYLRTGWVVGHLGLGQTLLVVLLANAITLLTTLSFSAIATNIRVGVGGAYYMISRSLGREFGGAIGLPLFLSQAFSVTLYAFGLAEALRFVYPELPMQPAALGIVALVGLLAFRGADLALKVQLPLMGLIALSLLALVLGALDGSPATLPEATEPVERVGFWVVFAVFFPAVTGIMAGLGMSGDLKDPVRAIPKGAITATLVGLVVYLVVPWLLLQGATPALLRQDPLAWTQIAPLGAWLVLPGLFGAIFSSAVGSVLGAPRTLQALALDRLAPRRLGEGQGPRQEPVLGLFLTLALAFAGVLLGDLDAVAPVVSMFFLTVYGMVNLVAALESLSGDPSWRPTLPVHWSLSLLGALGCIVVMFLIEPLAALGAVLVEAALFVWLSRRQSEERWGDVRRGVYESLIRWSLLKLNKHAMTARTWRPHALIFVNDIERRLGLVRFGSWFSQGRGVVTVCKLVVGDLLVEDLQRREELDRLRGALRREHLAAFGEVDVVKDVVTGIVDVAQANGLAGMDSNTVMLGLPKGPERLAQILQAVPYLERLHKNVLIGQVDARLWRGPARRLELHIWWGGLQNNGDLMLLLAHLLSLNPRFKGSRIRILSVASNEHMAENIRAHLERFLPETRIHAEAEVMLRPAGRSIRDIIHAESAHADVVFLGLHLPDGEDHLPYAQRLLELAEGLGTVFFVKNASGFGGKLVQTSEQQGKPEEAPPEPAPPPGPA